ncbi:MAG: DUF3108 domain-containing protein [Bacteroidetes bacterium]|nr:MAG: DUF3108 domain-containing protein [Bacteroidota bacterium]
MLAMTRLRAVKTMRALFIFFLVFLACLFVSNGSLLAGENHSTIIKGRWEASDTLLFQVGEELTYNVRYAFIDIGQVRIKIAEKVIENGKAIYKAIAYIDSYRGVPFVDLHTIYETKIASPICSEWFRARTKDDSKWWHITYTLDYLKREMEVQKGEFGASSVEKVEKLTLDTIYQDGLSLFYYARANVKQRKNSSVPTIIQEQKVSTHLNFLNERTTEEIDAVDYPIDVIHFDGRADFVGIFGLTGDFEGWFSNDEARVPILAKMKVLIGNVTIELMKWNRTGWTPPRGEDD